MISHTDQEETREYRALRPDSSVQFLVLSAAVSIAFLVGVIAGKAAPSAGSSITAPQRQHSFPPSLAGAGREADEYYLYASTSSAPGRPPLVIDSSVSQIYIHYSFPDWSFGQQLWLTCKHGRSGKELRKISHRPEKNRYPRGYFRVAAPSSKGFEPGIYLFEIRSASGQADAGSFAVVNQAKRILAQSPPSGAVVIGKPTISLGVDERGHPFSATDTVPASARTIYVCFPYDGAVEGMALEARWLYEGEEVAVARRRIVLPSVSGNAYAFIRCARGPLPVGRWRVEIYLEGARQALATKDFSVVPNQDGR